MTSVCFVMYDLSIVGGVERVVESLANKLTKHCSVHVISLHGQECNSALRFSDQIKTAFLHLPEGRLREQMMKAFFPLRKYFSKNKIDIAFLEATFSGFIGSPAGLFSKTKMVFCDHGALLNQINDKDVTKMRKFAATLCKKIVVLTKRSKDDYVKLFEINDQKIKYIYNWIGESMIDRNRVYHADSNIIITAGRFTKEKGFALLIQVASKVLPMCEGWKWYIYGEGPLESEIREEIHTKGLDDLVILKGFTDNMDLVYQNAGLYVLPSYREGVPLVLLEAKAYKIPCVSFDIVSGPNEIIDDGINGYLIKPYDIDMMADAIKRLIDDPAKRKQFSENAYLNIERFCEENIYNQWIELINELQ